VVTKNEVERAIERIDFVIMDFTETIDSLKLVKEVLCKVSEEKTQRPNKQNYTAWRNNKNEKRFR
jgi:hypothetical protein